MPDLIGEHILDELRQSPFDMERRRGLTGFVPSITGQADVRKARLSERPQLQP